MLNFVSAYKHLWRINMKFFNKLSLRATGALAAASLASLLASTSAYAEDKVTAVHAFPGFLVYTQTFLAMVDDINARGKASCKSR